MLSSKKEGYSPLDCSKAESKYCCLGGNDNRFAQFCSWNENENKCTWAEPEPNPKCQTIKGTTGRKCGDGEEDCCRFEYCNESTEKCTVTDAARYLSGTVPTWCFK